MQGPVVDYRRAEGGLRGVVLLGGELARLAVIIGGETGEIRAAENLKEEVLVLARGRRVAGALNGIAEVFGGERRSV